MKINDKRNSTNLLDYKDLRVGDIVQDSKFGGVYLVLSEHTNGGSMFNLKTNQRVVFPFIHPEVVYHKLNATLLIED